MYNNRTEGNEGKTVDRGREREINVLSLLYFCTWECVGDNHTHTQTLCACVCVRAQKAGSVACTKMHQNKHNITALRRNLKPAVV